QQAQELKITGKVTDVQKQPLPGVTVLVKGTTLGAVTDQNGMYALRLPEVKEDILLLYSFIGMETQEIKYQGKDIIDVVMREEVKEVEEVVVTGIFTRKKESFTGSSTTFTTKELKMVGNSNVLQSLKTLDPAFAIMENNEFGSDPNNVPNIEIRGKSSIVGLTDEYETDPNQPLFVLDGFETTLQTISDLSMDRVQSITILKDAAATAIYGSKAANGVIVVETKLPQAGALRLTYNANVQLSFADLSDYNLMNSYEKLTFERLAGCYRLLDGNGNIIDEEQDRIYNNLMKEVARGVDTYWMNEPLRFGVAHRHTLAIEGGDQIFRYGVGVTYGMTEGVMKGSAREVMNGNVRLIYRRGRLSFTNNLNIDYSKADREPVAFSEFAKANPYFRKYDENGELKKVLFSNYAATYYSPLFDMKQTNIDGTETIGFTNNFEVDWRVVDELRIRGRFGLTKSNEQGRKFRSPFNTEFASKDDNADKGSYEETNTKILNYDGDLSVTYGKLFNEKHMVNAVGGMRFSQNGSNRSGYKVQGFIDDEFTNPAFALGYQKDGKATYVDSKKRAISYYLNFGYSYDDRYLLDLNYRADGSSVFGSDKQFTDTWSVGLGWNIHKETFFKNVSAISLLKLRASIGNPGNQNFDDYISIRVYNYNTNSMNVFGSSAIVSNLGNQRLKWQKTMDRNIGFDAAVLDNRLRVNIDYFNKKTDPLLAHIGTPSSTGTKTIPRNVGKQITQGITVTMNYSIIRRDEMFWSVNANLRHQTSEYRNVSEVLTKYNLENRNRNLTRYYDGGSPSDLWAVRSCGIDPATGREIFLTREGKQTFVHDYDDEIVVGNSDPDVEGVIGTSFYYKGFSASINLRYRLGGQIFMQTLYDKVENLSSAKKWENLDKRALYDRWKQSGDNAKFKSIADSETTPMSSRFVEDNNVLSGESISLGYESSAQWLRHVGASSLSFRAYMNDIFRVSTVKNERGLSYPFARFVSFSLGVTF
ncbi:MAG: SusC/RagA family TonB-linked outer membrane protein, partial [Oscillibacter sp.]|nr:SusC/RagA family TonB-linked outer membrane protein [Oscillibacter sp.]